MLWDDPTAIFYAQNIAFCGVDPDMPAGLYSAYF